MGGEVVLEFRSVGLLATAYDQSKMTELTANSFNDLSAEILKRTRDACGGSAVLKSPFTIKMTSIRRGLFSSFTSQSGVRNLEKVVYQLGDSPLGKGGLKHYLRVRWYGLLIAIIAIIVFLAAIILCCMVSRKVRSFFKRALGCGSRGESADSSSTNGDEGNADSVSSRTRSRYMQSTLFQIGRRMRIGLAIMTLLCFAALAILTGFGIKSMVDIGSSTSVVNCNMWNELNGYFNGATDAKPASTYDAWANPQTSNVMNDFLSQYADNHEDIKGDELLSMITSNWLGSENIKKGLAELYDMTQLTEENPVHTNFTSGRKGLQSKIMGNRNELNSRLNRVNDLITKYDNILTNLNAKMAEKGLNMIGDWTEPYDITFGLKKVFQAKVKVFRTELDSTLALSWTTIDGLIEKYAGINSKLMAKANTAVQHSLSAILQIDKAMQSLYDIWRKGGRMVIALVVVTLVFAGVYFACAIVSSLLTILLSVRLLHSRVLRHGSATPGKSRSVLDHNFVTKGKNIWRAAYIVCGVGIAFCSLTIAITFFTAAAGNDACHMANTSLLSEGRWDLLGNSILHPQFDSIENQSVTSRVEMAQVLDTCMKRDGTGTVGIALGLDAAISDVTDDVNNAIEDINNTKEVLLLRKSRHMRIRIIGFIMTELLRGFSHNGHTQKSGAPATKSRHVSFNGLLDVNWENHTSITDGRRAMLAMVPYWPDLMGDKKHPGPVLLHGLLSTFGSLPDAYNMLNAVSDAAFAANPSSPLPRFCGATARERQLACSYFDDSRPVADLSSDISSNEIDAWLATLDTDVPSFGEYLTQIAERMKYLIGVTRYVENSAQLTADELGLRKASLPACVNADQCTFDMIRTYDVNSLTNDQWPPIRDNYDDIVAAVDDYVDNLVIPSSKSMVDKANDIMFKTNCQFQRQALEYGVVVPLCATILPATAELSLISFISIIVLSILAFLLWSYKPVFAEHLHIPTLAEIASPERASLVAVPVHYDD